MNKYTIKKLFEKSFPYPVWKIEVDSIRQNIAVESRDPNSTLPTYTIYSFEGHTLLDNYLINEKEWTIASIQGDYLILKKYGTSSPVQSGIRIIHFPTQTIIADLAEYIFQCAKKNTVIAIHRAIPTGLLYYITISNGKVKTTMDEKTTDYPNLVETPIPYRGKLPAFMSNLAYEDQIWLHPLKDIFIWSYHSKKDDKFVLSLSLSSKNETLIHKDILNNLNKLILQPYFAVNNYLFFLSDTKQKIITYLV